MLIPSLACPAECSYCFGPHAGPVMTAGTMNAALEFMARIVRETGQRKVRVTFHGGEPLLAGHELWRQALEGLDKQFGRGRYEVALQSNLWLLDDEFCALLRHHQVKIGTSLDGPERLTDQQRGTGYFARTMTGIRKAQKHGMNVGCIATFTPLTLTRWKEAFDFFKTERLGFSIHAAVHALDKTSTFALTPSQYTSLLRQILEYYVDQRKELAVSSLDQMCQGLGCGEGKVCTFRDCLGMFLTIDPNGDIYPCQRFAGQPQYRLGSLARNPTLDQLFTSPIAKRFLAYQQTVYQSCRDCPHLKYCKGGCPYNAWASEGNCESATGEYWVPKELEQQPSSTLRSFTPFSDDQGVVDPYCKTYRNTFNYIQQRLAVEMASEENINAIAERPYNRIDHLLLRKGPLIELVREGSHPSQVARTAKRIVAAVELAKEPDIPAVGKHLLRMGLCRTQQSAEISLSHLWRQIHSSRHRLNNLYLHVTFNCQLHCTHCYARAGSTETDPSIGGLKSTNGVAEMPITALEKLIIEAKECGFRQVIITGGEPLTHSQSEAMLNMLTKARTGCAPMNLVLRTNLALPMDEHNLGHIAAAFDQVVASVDGNQQIHDSRRGQGTYAATIRNLEAYTTRYRNTFSPRGIEQLSGLPSTHLAAAEISLACVLRAVDIQSEPGQSIHDLAQRLGIHRIRFRPLLPIGRAADWNEPPVSEALSAYIAPLELIEKGFHPTSSCGFGQNLYVEPSGESFPCYACQQTHSFLGNVIDHGLATILQAETFLKLARHSVDTNPQCRTCAVRYLCGGACRAWGGPACQRDYDAPHPECNGLRARANILLAAAIDYLGCQSLS
ncbi:MAG: TIGR04083 family peptide-modifying radical SAM enzyme [Pseudomonadota bacterium]